MRRAALVSVGSLLLVGSLGTSALAHGHHRHRRGWHPSGDDTADVPAPRALMLDRHSPRGVTVYVNGDGGTISGGWDDSANDVSSVAYGMDHDVKVPAWKGGKKAWQKVVQCVQDRFSDFNVDIVTDRPSDGDYVMIMVGGYPSLLGYGDSVGGIAPYTGEVVRKAVGFVFSANEDNDVENTCVAILHETGHTLGLDHEYLCEDPMSYLWGCGEKHWQDQDAPCGENEERECGTGEPTQNSYQILANNVGLRGDRRVDDDPPVENDPPPVANDPPDSDEPPCDGGGAASDDSTNVSIDAPEQTAGNGWIEIDVHAEASAGVTEVELGWASEDQQFVFACSSIGDDQPATCTQDGDIYRFQLYVGTGLRAMAARATDENGDQTITDAQLIYLTDG
jgi:hypothetical protein